MFLINKTAVRQPIMAAKQQLACLVQQETCIPTDANSTVNFNHGKNDRQINPNILNNVTKHQLLSCSATKCK